MDELNLNMQYYKGIPLKLIKRKSYSYHKAKRFTLNNTNQNVWIPNVYLLPDGTIRANANLDWLFSKKNVVRNLCLARYDNWKDWR